MLDLSNNNGTAHDFRAAYKAGQRRLYLKVSEGTWFDDDTAKIMAADARRILIDGKVKSFKVGGYHFARPDKGTTPKDEADYFARAYLKFLGPLRPGKDLRPCLDLETGHPDASYGAWARQFIARVEVVLGVKPIIYSYSSFLGACRFTKEPADLWLASYGPNDGVPHPYRIPSPWGSVCAHQFTSNGRIPGIATRCDVSVVKKARKIDVLPWYRPF